VSNIHTRDIGSLTVTVGFYEDHPMDRSAWPSGPWDEELFDWAIWTDTATGFRCAIKRNGSGAWCGYVLTPQDHPVNRRVDDDFGGDLTSGNPVWLDVHGGVTFHGRWALTEMDEAGHAVGFDCNHYMDAAPRYESMGNGEYRTAMYAVSETRGLARQIADYQPLEQLVSGTNADEESQ